MTGNQSKWLSSEEARTQAWHDQNDYMMDREQVKKFKEAAKDRPIFLCGTTQKDEAALDLFDIVI